MFLRGVLIDNFETVLRDHCKHIIFDVYDIWLTLNFLLFGMDFIWHLIQFHFIP